MAMASKEMSSVFDEHFLTCHICLEEYKDPRVLPCYHTFCLECIADHAAKNGVQNKFSCPVCRQEAPVPPGGLETLVKNFFLRKVTDIMKDQRAPEGKLCEYCNKNESSLLCQECTKTNQLCAICREVHDKIPTLNGHHFIALSQVHFPIIPANIQEQLRQVKDEVQYCDKHDGELLKFYCEEDDTVACRDCIFETHDKHDFKKLEDVVWVQRRLIREKLKYLPTKKLSRFEKAEKAIVQMEERLSENQTEVLGLVDSQKVTMMDEIKENSRTTDKEITAYYKQIEEDVRQQTDAYLTSVKQRLETYRANIQSNYTEMERNINDKSNEISAEVKALISTQVKTLEAEKDKQEMNKISIQSIRDFAQQLLNTGSEIEVMTHSKKLQTRIQEFQTVEPDFDTKITDITFTPGQTKTDIVPLVPQIPKPHVSIKKGSITTQKYQGPVDECFGRLKQKKVCPGELKTFQRLTFLEKPVRTFHFDLWAKLLDVQCTGHGCFLVAFAKHVGFVTATFFGNAGATVSEFSSTGQCNREISIEGGARCITTVSNDRFVVTCEDTYCRLYSTSGHVIQCFGQGDMSDPWGVTVDRTEGKVYVCDSDAQCICMYEMISFQLVSRIRIPMCSKGPLRCAYHHGINAIIVSDYSAHCVYAVTPQGDVMFQYGARGQSGSGDGQLSNPRGVCVDKFGHIFIVDSRKDRVVFLGSNGRFERNILTRNDGIINPVSVDVSSNGELVVGTNGFAISTYKYIGSKKHCLTL